jgi:lysophospholipase L1-like esterase
MSGPRVWLARLAIALVATVLALKVGDLAVGGLLHTRQRHLLRLPAGARQHHQSTEFDYTFLANSLGLRGPERPYAKPPGTRRIVVVGDSFVAGYGVADDAVFTTRLEALLKGESKLAVEVINVGRNGTSTIRELDLYTMIGRRFMPDVVVLCYFLGNDLREVVEEHDQQELSQWHPQGTVRRAAYALCPNLYLELALVKMSAEARAASQPRGEAQVLAALKRSCEQEGGDLDAATAAYQRLPPHVKWALENGQMREHLVFSACFDPGRIRRSLNSDDGYFEKAWPRTQRHLELLRHAVAADGAKLAVMVIPDAVQIDASAQHFAAEIGYQIDRGWLDRPCRTQQAVAAWCEGAGVPYLDLTEGLRQSKEPMYFKQDGHFNAAGHQRTAELLAEFLRDKVVGTLRVP